MMEMFLIHLFACNPPTSPSTPWIGKEIGDREEKEMWREENTELWRVGRTEISISCEEGLYLSFCFRYQKVLGCPCMISTLWQQYY